MLIKFKILCKRHLQNNFTLYLVLISCFMVGIIVGSIIVNRSDGDFDDKLYEITDNLSSSLITNFKFVLPIYLLGLVRFGIIFTPLILCWKGLNIGFTVGAIVKIFGARGFIFTVLGLLPQYFITIPGLLGISAISLSNSNHLNKGIRRGKDNYSNFGDYSMISILLLILFFIGSLVEVYVTPFFYNFIN
ncbi:MAG: stage II sporulation protein M [Tissierellaceae bacterium]|nr:stage II sporulation protein M [Tissierellaceae bacterium]